MHFGYVPTAFIDTQQPTSQTDRRSDNVKSVNMFPLLSTSSTILLRTPLNWIRVWKKVPAEKNLELQENMERVEEQVKMEKRKRHL